MYITLDKTMAKSITANDKTPQVLAVELSDLIENHDCALKHQVVKEQSVQTGSPDSDSHWMVSTDADVRSLSTPLRPSLPHMTGEGWVGWYGSWDVADTTAVVEVGE